MSENLRELNRDAFSSCTSLKSIGIPIGVKYIDNGVFFGCTALESISLPDSIVAIYTEVFRDCTSLREIYFAGTKEQWNAIKVYEDNDALKTANIYFAGEYPFTDVEIDGRHAPFAMRYSGPQTQASPPATVMAYSSLTRTARERRS